MAENRGAQLGQCATVRVGADLCVVHRHESRYYSSVSLSFVL
jgi:hypothetical protein